METSFGASAPYTVGIEEEFQLLDPASLALTPTIEAVLDAREAAGFAEDAIASELFASFLEVRSPARGTVADLAVELPALRRRTRKLVEGCGARLASAGTHPFSDAPVQEITNKDRYHRMEREMGWTARMQAIFGLHVHVAVPDEEYAIQAVNALARHVPLFVALSANSPFWAGRDTRLASARTKIFGLFPRSGLPPRFGSWEDFENHVDVLVSAGSIPDYSWCWWDVRPHPKLGTVELRAPDAQTDVGRAVSLAALAQCIVATAGDHAPENPLLTDENKWRAARHGMDATFYDFASGETTGARQAALYLLERLRPVAQDLGCEAELAGVKEIPDRGTGAESQRGIFEEHGSLADVASHVADATA